MKKLSKKNIKLKEKQFDKFLIPRTLKNFVFYFPDYVKDFYNKKSKFKK